MKGVVVKMHPNGAHLSVGEVATCNLGNQGQQVHPNEYHFVSMLSAIGFIREQHHNPPSNAELLRLLGQLEEE